MNTAIRPMYRWNEINWRKLERGVFKLQKRIFQASNRGNVKLVRSLQKLLISSWTARLLAVRRVTQDNQGKKTAGDVRVMMQSGQYLTVLKANQNLS